MIGRTLFVAARLAVAAIVILAWAYAVVTQSSFAFEQMIKPRLFPFLADFVIWHHAWFAVAYLLSAATLVPVLRSRERGLLPAKVAALGYLAVIGSVAAMLLGRPYLASLSGARDLLVVPGALLPLLWLAVIDHLQSAPRVLARGSETADQRTLLFAAAATALGLWLAHAIRWRATAGGDLVPSIVTPFWTLSLDLGAAVLAASAFGLASAIASRRANPAVWEYAVAVTGIAALITELARRVILPTLAFSERDCTLIAVPLGITVALSWGGARLRAAADRGGGLFTVFAFHVGPAAVALALIAITMTVAAIGFSYAEIFDWATIPAQLVALVEAAIVFGLALPLARRLLPSRPWSLTMMLGPAAVATVLLHALAPASAVLTSRLAGSAIDPQSLADRALSADPLARVASAALLTREPFNIAFHQRVLAADATGWSVSTGGAKAAAPPAPARPPHIFIFAIDSLRRDYLSVYNPRVTFTAAIGQWAREADVFQQAVTQYGGTHMSLPALWSGRLVPRGWGTIFKEINLFEPYIRTAGYDFVINDFTFEQSLRADTTRTFLEPEITSVNTDFCSNVDMLAEHMRRGGADRPVFTFLAPMNLHILNTRAPGVDTSGYPGFYAPYARQLERVDGCFGRFITFLKAGGYYDNSIIVLTSDHGDSLGEDGLWGHQNYLVPQVVQVPLIVRLPDELAARVTADLGRITPLTDIAPSLLSVIGGRPYDLGSLGGATFYAPPGVPLRDRRREAVLIMSSYGPIYGLLRRNGLEMYVADLANFREHFYVQRAGGYREERLGDARRRVNQAEILSQVDHMEQLYKR